MSIVVVSAAAFLTDVERAGAFCIENRADESLTFVVDIDGRGQNAPYVRTLAPQERACCDWQRYDCNASGKKTGTMKLSVRRLVGSDEWVCFGDFRADDELYFRSRGGSSSCSWGSSSSPFGTEYWYQVRDWIGEQLAALANYLLAQWRKA